MGRSSNRKRQQNGGDQSYKILCFGYTKTRPDVVNGEQCLAQVWFLELGTIFWQFRLAGLPMNTLCFIFHKLD